MAEPTFHFYNDCVPEHYVYAHESRVGCIDCDEMVLCINEIMQPFFITGKGVICLDCFYKRYKHEPTKEEFYYWNFEQLELPNG